MPVNAVTEHYRQLLAPIYQWMAGGSEAACRQGAADLAALGIRPSAGLAVDLGAGFGMHSIPLAQLGYAVEAIDSSPLLVSQLRQLASGLRIRATEADLLDFAQYLVSAPTLFYAWETPSRTFQALTMSSVCAAVSPRHWLLAAAL